MRSRLRIGWLLVVAACFAGSAWAGPDSAATPVGRVQLPAALERSPDLDLHLFHAVRGEISPRRALSEVGEGVLIPAGKAVGAVWNRKTRYYVAVSRPFEVREGQTLEIPFEKAGEGAAVVAQIERHKRALRAEDMEVKLVIQRKEAQRPPDLAIFTADRVYGFWYGLPPGAAEIRGDHRESYVPGQNLDLQAGKIERVTAQMKPLPALEVQLDVPSALMHEKPVLEIYRIPRGEALEHRALAPDAGLLRFERLPATLLQVVLQTSIGAFSKQVDLGSGQDGFLLLKPELIVLAGRVFHGDEGHPAKLTFANAARETTVASEDDGRYEAVFLEPVQTVSIRLEGVERDPYFDFFRPPISASQEMDFHLADGDFRVRVLDAKTGEGIAGAAVEIRNNFDSEPGRSGASKDRAVFQTVKTGEAGEARLPPLRPGSVEMRASAKGYGKMREATKVEILDENADQTFELRLDPIGATVAVRLRLPGGAPASGAQVLLTRSLAAVEELFSDQADGEGVVQIPSGMAGYLLIKHPAAAASIRDWRPQPEPAEETRLEEWALPVPAESPLTVQVKDSTGTQGVARASVALWLGGHRLSGPGLAWLTGSRPFTDQNGLWAAKNLPRTALSVLAWDPAAGEAGASNFQATTISYPWTGLVEIRLAE